MFLSDLMPDLTMEVPNLTDVQAMRALTKAARRFYSDTLLWQVLRTYSLAENTNVLRMSKPIEECTIKVVNRVYFEGEELRPLNEEEYLSMSREASSNRPVGFYANLDGESMLIAPIARLRQDNAYAVNVVLIPTLDADELPLDMHSEFEPAYIAAALAQLYGTGNFVNPGLADYNESKYQALVTQAINKRDGLYQGYANTVGYGGL